MADTVTIKVDTREFDRMLDSLYQTSTKEAAYFINDQGRRLAWECFELAPKTEPQAIESGLNAFSQQTTRTIKRGKRAGQTVTSNQKRFSSRLVYKVVNTLRKRRGEDPIWGRKMGVEARRLIAKRKSGIGYIKSGFLIAAGRFAAAIGKPLRSSKIRGKPKGDAVIAKPTTLAKVRATMIIHSVQSFSGNSMKAGKAFDISMAVIQKAMAIRMVDIQSQLNKRMHKVAKDHSSRR